MQDPLTEGNDQATFLSDADELGGRKEAQNGVLPPHERLVPRQGSGAGVEQTLVVHDQLPVRHRPPQVTFQVDPFICLLAHRWLEGAHAVLATLLGAVHGDICVFLQRGHVLTVIRCDGHTNRASHVKHVTLHLDWACQLVEDFVSHPLGVCRPAQVVQDDREFVATHPGDQITGPHDLA